MVSPIGAAISIEGRRGIPLELVGEFRRGQLRNVHRPCRKVCAHVAPLKGGRLTPSRILDASGPDSVLRRGARRLGQRTRRK